MKQTIVNVAGLTIEEKQRVNEALAKIKNIEKLSSVGADVAWLYAPSQYGENTVSWNGERTFKEVTATHTPQQVLEMAGMETSADQHVFLADKFIITDSSGSIVYDGTLRSISSFIKSRVSAGEDGSLPSSGFSVKTDENGVAVMVPKQGHPHAHLMAMYAEDAKTTDKPWELWQIKAGSSDWISCKLSPAWDASCEFRRKPKTRTVNGVEVPDLRIEPKAGDRYYLVDPTEPEFTFNYAATSGGADSVWVERGLCYEYTEEGKQAAILHAKAWLGIA